MHDVSIATKTDQLKYLSLFKDMTIAAIHNIHPLQNIFLLRFSARKTGEEGGIGNEYQCL